MIFRNTPGRRDKLGVRRIDHDLGLVVEPRAERASSIKPIPTRANITSTFGTKSSNLVLTCPIV
jgi:hypothetical protein